MLVHASLSALKDGRWYEYVVRFALGGAATALTGLVAKFAGPSTAGLFRALPAIFCASATLIERHEIRRKRAAGLHGERRGKQAAGLDACGAAFGGLGLLAFAIVFAALVERSVSGAFAGAAIGWLLTSILVWRTSRKMRSAARNRG